MLYLGRSRYVRTSTIRSNKRATNRVKRCVSTSGVRLTRSSDLFLLVTHVREVGVDPGARTGVSWFLV